MSDASQDFVTKFLPIVDFVGPTRTLKLTSYGIVHYLLSAGLSKSFSQLIVPISNFCQYFFNRFCLVEKCEITLHS